MTAALSRHASYNLDENTCAGPHDTSARPLQQLDNLHGAMDDPPARRLKRKRGHALESESQKPEARPMPPQSHRQSITTGEFHNHSQPSTNGSLVRSPARSLSTATTTTTGTRERSQSMLSASTPPTDTDLELAARMDEIHADGWVRKITDDSIECFLCGRWYRVGQQYRNMHIWRAHRKKCPQRTLAARGLRKSNTPVAYVAHRRDIDPDDEFAQEWIDHPHVQDLDKTHVHCNRCNTRIQRNEWATHVETGCIGKKRHKGYVYESVSSSDDEPKFNSKPRPSNDIQTKQKLIASKTGAPPARATWNSLSANVDVFPVRLPTPTRKSRPRSQSGTTSRKIDAPVVEVHSSSDSDDDASVPPNRQGRPPGQRAVPSSSSSLSSDSESDKQASSSSSSSSSSSDVSSSSSKGGSLIQRAKRPGPPPASQRILAENIMPAEEGSSSSDDSDDEGISAAPIARARRGTGRGLGRGIGGISRGRGTGRGGRPAGLSVVIPTASDAEVLAGDMTALALRASVTPGLPSASPTPRSAPAATTSTPMTSAAVTSTAATTVGYAPRAVARAGFRVPKLMRRSTGDQQIQQQQTEAPSQLDSRKMSASGIAVGERPTAAVASASVVGEQPALSSATGQPAAAVKSYSPVRVPEHRRRASFMDVDTGKIALPTLHRGRRLASDQQPSAPATNACSLDKASGPIQPADDMQIDSAPTTRESDPDSMLLDDTLSISSLSTGTVAASTSQSPASMVAPLKTLEPPQANLDKRTAPIVVGTSAPLRPWHRADGVPYVPYPYLQRSDGPRLGVSFQQEAEHVDMKGIPGPSAKIPRMKVVVKPVQQPQASMPTLNVNTPTHAVSRVEAAPLPQSRSLAVVPAHTSSTLLAGIASRTFDPSIFASAFQTSIFGSPTLDPLPHGVPSRSSWNTFASAPSSIATSHEPSAPSHEELVRKYGRYLHPGPAPFYSFRHEPRPESVGRLSSVAFPSTTSNVTSSKGDTETTRPKFDVTLMMESTTSHFRTTVDGSRGLWRAAQPCSTSAAPATNALTLAVDRSKLELAVVEEQWPPPVDNTVGLSLMQVLDAKISPFAF